MKRTTISALNYWIPEGIYRQETHSTNEVEEHTGVSQHTYILYTLRNRKCGKVIIDTTCGPAEHRRSLMVQGDLGQVLLKRHKGKRIRSREKRVDIFKGEVEGCVLLGMSDL